MGGPVSVVIRDAQGETHKMRFWTDMVQKELLRPDVLKNAPGAIEALVERHARAGQIYAENCIEGLNPNFLSGALYGSPALLAPEEYGLIVLDFSGENPQLFSMSSAPSLTRPTDYELMFGDTSPRDSQFVQDHISEGWVDQIRVTLDDGLVEKAIDASFHRQAGETNTFIVRPEDRQRMADFIAENKKRPFPQDVMDRIAASVEQAGNVDDAMVSREDADLLKEFAAENSKRFSTPCHGANVITTLGGIEVAEFYHDTATMAQIYRDGVLPQRGFYFNDAEEVAWAAAISTDDDFEFGA